MSFTKYVDLYFADFYMEKSDSCIPIFGMSVSFLHLHFSGLAHTEASQPAEGHARWSPVLEFVFLLTPGTDFPDAIKHLHMSKTTDELG